MNKQRDNIDRFVVGKDGKVYVVAGWDGIFYTLMGADIIIVESLKDYEDYEPTE